MRPPSSPSRSYSVTATPAAIIHHGFIYKLKHDSTTRRPSTISRISHLLGRSNWVQRYMMLCKNIQSDGVMRYLCMGLHKQVTWVLPIVSIVDIYSLSDTTHSLTHSHISPEYHTSCFELHTQDRIFVIRCYDSYDCEMWMRVIHDARHNQQGDIKAFQSQLSRSPSLSHTSSPSVSSRNITHEPTVPKVQIPHWHVDDSSLSSGALTTTRQRLSSMPCDISSGALSISNSIDRLSSSNSMERFSGLNKSNSIEHLKQQEDIKQEDKDIKIATPEIKPKSVTILDMKQQDTDQGFITLPPPHPTIQPQPLHVRTDSKILERIIETSPCITPLFHTPAITVSSS